MLLQILSANDGLNMRRVSNSKQDKRKWTGVWLTLEVAGCGDIEPISEPIAPQSFGLSLAPARNNDIIVRTALPTDPPLLLC